MLRSFVCVAVMALPVVACSGDPAPTDPVVAGDAAIPDAPGSSGETTEKPAGEGQAGEAAAVAAPKKAEASASDEKIVAAGALNVRNAPTMTGAVVRTLSKGAKVQATNCAKGWCQIGEGEFVGAKHLQ